MSKVNNLPYVSHPRIANKPVIAFLLALVILVSFIPLFALSSEAATVSLKLTPVRGIIGASVTAAGHGYVPGAKVTIQFGSIIVATQTTNSTGGFSLTFVVPQVRSGKYSVIASDGMGNSKSTPFTVISKAHITLHPTSGVAGILVTITGKNFAYNSALTVKFNGKSITTGTTSSTGTINLSFTVPNDALGSYAVLVTDALGYAASAAFTIT